MYMHTLSYSHFQCGTKLISCFPRPPPPPTEDVVCWNEPSNILFAIFHMRLLASPSALHSPRCHDPSDDDLTLDLLLLNNPSS